MFSITYIFANSDMSISTLVWIFCVSYTFKKFVVKQNKSVKTIFGILKITHLVQKN